MTTESYLNLFETILSEENNVSPYDNPAYLNYVKLNHSRQKRWFKTGALLQETKTKIAAVNTAQTWIIISEPWCGDAAHNIPFLLKIAELNPLITVEFQLRDAAPFLIEKYLTNGGKSIPKLVVRNEKGVDLFTWGPRPKECQALMLANKAANLDAEMQKISIQDWYNVDKGMSLQKEIIALMP